MKLWNLKEARFYRLITSLDIDTADVFVFAGLVMAFIGACLQFNINVGLMFAGAIILTLGVCGGR